LTAREQIDLHTCRRSQRRRRHGVDAEYTSCVDSGVDVSNGYSTQIWLELVHGSLKRLLERRLRIMWVSTYLRGISIDAVINARSPGIPVFVKSDSKGFQCSSSQHRLAAKTVHMDLNATLIACRSSGRLSLVLQPRCASALNGACHD
jgi:hypothetical protein